MATSESDDFESADEEMSQDPLARRKAQSWPRPTAVDSESDDDTEFVPRTMPRSTSAYSEQRDRPYRTAAKPPATQSQVEKESDATKSGNGKVEGESKESAPEETAEHTSAGVDVERTVEVAPSQVPEEGKGEVERVDKVDGGPTEAPKEETERASGRSESRQRENARGQRRSEGLRQSGAKKLGTRISKSDTETSATMTDSQIDKVESADVSVSKEQSDNAGMDDKELESRLCELSEEGNKGELSKSGTMEELSESDMPEELKSDKKFKDIFKPQGWEGLGNDVELPEELTEDKLQPVLERLSLAGQDSESNSGSWGSWGGWGVSSLINTATVGVSTLTSHVTHGLTLLEESIGASDVPELASITEQEEIVVEDKSPSTPEESQLHIPFGFSNLMSGVSSITRLVESTGNKVMTGGLGTLEAIGKKTMEVLQEGDPGLKKKRAFFMQEADKPILSQILREAKEKAETEEKTLEEKQLARKVHFESLFDDNQGLVHLEALEMLSNQSDIKIQQYLAASDSSKLISIQEILEEIKELCNIGDEQEADNRDFKIRLEEACKDLGVNISYEKLNDIWEESRSYLNPSVSHTEQEIYQTAISTIAQFTAYSVERFHKTAELILINAKRSTVNEADALVRLTSILSSQIGVLANSFGNSLNKLAKTTDEPDEINAKITTIFFEAMNASSYVEDAFRLLIPIIQVGAI